MYRVYRVAAHFRGVRFPKGNCGSIRVAHPTDLGYTTTMHPRMSQSDLLWPRRLGRRRATDVIDTAYADQSSRLMTHRPVFDPGPSVPPGSFIGQIRMALASVGGVCGGRELALRLGCAPNRIKDGASKSQSIQGIGAGYWALTSARIQPVADWLVTQLLEHGPMSLSEAVGRVLQAYPFGHPDSIRRWIYQDPGRLQYLQGTITVLRQRWRTR